MVSPSSHCFLIFPHQLFEVKYLQTVLSSNAAATDFFLIEEPLFFGSPERVPTFHRLKLILHRASMMYYQDMLEKESNKKNKSSYIKSVTYMDYKTLMRGDGNRQSYGFLKRYKHVHYFDVTDHLLNDIIEKEVKRVHASSYVHDTPLFLTPTKSLADYMESYQKKGGNPFYHKAFYQWQLKRMKLPYITKSYDTDNRKSLPKNSPVIQQPDGDGATHYVKEATAYVATLFPLAFGDKKSDFIYPVTHHTAKQWLDHFLKNKLHRFGTYQDALPTDSRNTFVYHSILSSSLNIGLLDPAYVVQRVVDFYEHHKTTVGINNYEGFLRQLVGWREYERLLYIYYYDTLLESNHFENQNTLPKEWFILDAAASDQRIPPLDAALRNIHSTAYLHHIQRLMVVMNYMTLLEISPREIYQWFMAMSIDSYDWVMITNVYSMGYATPKTMRKPYLSGSNYLLKMMGQTKTNTATMYPACHGFVWTELWDALFYRFIVKKQKQLQGTPYIRLISAWRKKSVTDKRRHSDILLKFYPHLTTIP
jgi:deoxyribodipyrimidine photolyase-related protein